MKSKLLTRGLKDKFPALHTNDKKRPDEIKVIAKFYYPYSSWTWYAIEGEPLTGADGKEEDFLMFGLVWGTDKHLANFRLSELESINIKGAKILRDTDFETGKYTLSEVREKRL